MKSAIVNNSDARTLTVGSNPNPSATIRYVLAWRQLTKGDVDFVYIDHDLLGDRPTIFQAPLGAGIIRRSTETNSLGSQLTKDASGLINKEPFI